MNQIILFMSYDEPGNFILNFSVLMSQIILLSSLLSLASGQLSVSLVDTAVMVNEGEQFALRVRKSGTITQSITVIVEVSFQGFSLLID